MRMEPKRFVELLTDCEQKVRSYSGRGMMGRDCVGVVVSRREDLLLLGVTLAGQLVNEWGGTSLADCPPDAPEEVGQLVELLSEGVFEVDNMGIDTIIYWEKIPWPVGVRDPHGKDYDLPDNEE